MGWSPSVNFSLRDDEIVFGDLIMDKKTAEKVSKLLMQLKNGEQPEDTKEVLKDVYQNEEFTKIKQEYKEIKEDLKYFKEALKGKWKLGSSIEAAGNKLGNTISYAVGSTSWIEKYKAQKQLAATMFEKLLTEKFDFGDELKKYHDRYDEYLNNSDYKERMKDILRAERDDKVLSGMDYIEAEKERIQAEIDSGIGVKENKMMLLALGSAGVKIKNEAAREMTEAAKAEQEVEDSLASTVNQFMEEAEFVEVTYDDLLNHIVNKLDCGLSEEDKKKWRNEVHSSIVAPMYEDCGLSAPSTEVTEESFNKVIENMKYPTNAGLFRLVGVKVDKQVYESIMRCVKDDSNKDSTSPKARSTNTISTGNQESKTQSAIGYVLADINVISDVCKVLDFWIAKGKNAYYVLEVRERIILPLFKALNLVTSQETEDIINSYNNHEATSKDVYDAVSKELKVICDGKEWMQDYVQKFTEKEWNEIVGEVTRFYNENNTESGHVSYEVA